MTNVGRILFTLAVCAKAALMVQKSDYESADCTGQVLRTEYMSTSCSQSRDGGYYTIECNSTAITMNYFNDSSCATSTGQSMSFELDTCSEDNDKYVSCTETDVVTVNAYTEGCSSEFLQASMSLPQGCRPTGSLDNGQVRAQSNKVQVSGTSLVSQQYSASLDCTGVYTEVTLPCDGVCVNGSNSEALPDGFFAFQSSCSSLSGSGDLGGGFSAGTMSHVSGLTLLSLFGFS